MRFPVIVAALLVAFPLVPAESIAFAADTNSPTAHQVTLAWDPSPDPSVAGYLVYVGVSGPLQPTAYDAGSNTVFTVAYLEAGVTYTFYVTAYDSARNESDPSNSIDYTPGATVTDTNPPPAPNAPENLQAVGSGRSQITLAWDDTSTGEDGFRIERSLDGLNFLPIATVGPGVTQFLVNDPSGFPAAIYPYWFRVAAFKADVVSPYSNPAIAITNQADLTLIAVSTIPALPEEGMPVRFQATVRNLGRAATPQGVNARVAFSLDGSGALAWADNTNSLPPGGTITLTSDAGPGPNPDWVATPGYHTVGATVDDLNLLTEANEWNNYLGAELLVASTNAPVITISLDRTNISEQDAAGCVLTVTRDRAMDSDLAVQLIFSGTARNGQDYNYLPDIILIPASAASTTIAVTPIDDIRINPPRTLGISLYPWMDYRPAPDASVTLTIADSDVDRDGDGMSDREEFVAGTDPLDPNSNLRILSLEPQPTGEVVVTWSSVPGFAYQVLARESPDAGYWTVVSPPVSATNSMTSWTDAPAGLQRFYQITVSP